MVVKDAAGHRNLKTTMRYAKILNEDVVSALNKVKWMGGAEKANVMVRIAQAMGGAEFRDFNIKIKPN